MIAATATPSTLITASDFAAEIRAALRALSFCLRFPKAPQPRASVPHNLLNDIGIDQAHLMALSYA